MRIELDGGGRINMQAPQRYWHGNDAMQTARYAGQEVTAITDDAGCFDLHYLGYMTSGFKTMEDAKASADTFIRTVLAHMATLI